MLELGSRVGGWSRLGNKAEFKGECRARNGRRKSTSGRAGAWCRTRTGCAAEARARGEVVPVSVLNTSFLAPPTICVFSAWHLPKVLIRQSAIRAGSGASTFKDKKRRRAISKKHTFLEELNCWRGARGTKNRA